MQLIDIINDFKDNTKNYLICDKSQNYSLNKAKKIVENNIQLNGTSLEDNWEKWLENNKIDIFIDGADNYVDFDDNIMINGMRNITNKFEEYNI